MMQLSKAAKALMVFVCIAVVALYSTNKRSSDDSGDLRGKELERIVDTSSSTTTDEVQQSDDALMHFKNRAHPIPSKEWAKLDNHACIVNEEGDGRDLEKWQRRAPYVLIVGAMKAGTTALNHYLAEHSSVISGKRKEIHFYDFHFDKYATEKGILRRSARQAYADLYRRQTIGLKVLQEDDSKIALDDSPRYLFWSDRIPARVLCVSPWVKILAVLRNPIDRAFSQYNMFLNAAGKSRPVGFTFKQWIEEDIQDMKNTGLLQDSIPLSEFSGSAEEMVAWKAYTRLGTHAPLGRGLYAIQLRHWFKAFEEAGKSLDDIFIIQSELMKEKPALVYADVLKFLGLDDEPLVDEEEENFPGNYHIKLNRHTRKKLEELYAPYNQELYDLLGDDWGGVWDP
jgi:hypothetical protein